MNDPLRYGKIRATDDITVAPDLEKDKKSVNFFSQFLLSYVENSMHHVYGLKEVWYPP